MRWLSLSAEYNFVVHYKPGPTNILADALSRRSAYVQSGRHAIEGITAVEVTAISPFCESIVSAYEADASCSEMIKYLRDPSDTVHRQLSPRSRARIDHYALDDSPVGLRRRSPGFPTRLRPAG
ncbi:reverse transcriptase [Phytophthora megakarya]|uniref:Reverse transcriptase n=1 Tax=Phytophthora megakarya TaxID=4795 RepID=A0A225VVB5_9STRA|nr:reverse transcriptase [Phytophthora megakarya]